MPGIAASTPFFAHKKHTLWAFVLPFSIAGACLSFLLHLRVLILDWKWDRLGFLLFFFWNIGGFVHFIQFLWCILDRALG